MVKASMPTEKKSAVIYARYSSHAQKDASIEQQVNECEKYAKDNGFSISHIYADRAVSGKTDRRIEFQRMMRDAENGKFRFVISWKSNRMGRNMLEALLNESKLQNFGIRVLYTEEDFDNSAAGRFALRSMMNVNQFYSENMAEDIVRGMRDNAANCKVNNGILPLGYCKGKDGKYAIAPSEAEIVVEVFTKFLADTPLIDIANELNARGVTTKTGGPWNKNSFSKMLSNERYVGVYIWSDIRIENGVPKIIEKEMFDAVQIKLKSKKIPRGRHREAGDYMLTGKLFCGKCGSLMTGMSGTSSTGMKHYYYACQTARSEKSCNKKAVKREYIEHEVVRHIRDYILQDDVIDWMVDSYMDYQHNTFDNQQLISSKDRLAQVTIEIKNLVDAIAKGMTSRSTKTRLLELEAEEDNLTHEIDSQTCKMKPFSRERVRFYFESFRDGDYDNAAFRKRLINQFVDSIYLYDDEIRISFSGPGNSERIPFEIIGDVEKQSAGEVRISSFLLHQRSAKRTFEATIYSVGSTFVLVSGL